MSCDVEVNLIAGNIQYCEKNQFDYIKYLSVCCKSITTCKAPLYLHLTHIQATARFLLLGLGLLVFEHGSGTGLDGDLSVAVGLLGLLGRGEDQHTVLQVRRELGGVDVRPDREGLVELGFRVRVVLAHLATAGDVDDAAVVQELDVDVLLGNAGDVERDLELLVALGDFVHRTGATDHATGVVVEKGGTDQDVVHEGRRAEEAVVETGKEGSGNEGHLDNNVWIDCSLLG